MYRVVHQRRHTQLEELELLESKPVVLRRLVISVLPSCFETKQKQYLHPSVAASLTDLSCSYRNLPVNTCICCIPVGQQGQRCHKEEQETMQ